MGILTAIKNLFKDEFSPVYELQNEVVKRGGKINKASDLVAAFEKRSLIPNRSPKDALSQLVIQNRSDKFKDLFSYDLLAYELNSSLFDIPSTWKPVRLKHGEKLGKNQKFNLNEKTNEKAGFLEISDNEFLVRNQDPFIDEVISLNPKYIGILRLINNNIFIPNNYRMKRQKSLILGISIIISALIFSFAYAYTNRYYVDFPVVIDKWTGKYIKVQER
jgi:hypothetical protein